MFSCHSWMDSGPVDACCKPLQNRLALRSRFWLTGEGYNLFILAMLRYPIFRLDEIFLSCPALISISCRTLTSPSQL